MNWKAWWQAWRRRRGSGSGPGGRRAGFNPFRVLLDGNRRRESGPAGATRQLEMRLQDVKPVRNSLFNDDVEVVKRSRSRLIYETPGEAMPARGKAEAESDRAWERLRGRRLDTLRVGSE